MSAPGLKEPTGLGAYRLWWLPWLIWGPLEVEWSWVGMSHQMMCLVSNQITNSKKLGVRWDYSHIMRSPSSGLLDRIDSSKKFLAILFFHYLNQDLVSTNYISVYYPSGCKCWWLQQEHFFFRASVLGQMIKILCRSMVLAQGHMGRRWQIKDHLMWVLLSYPLVDIHIHISFWGQAPSPYYLQPPASSLTCI